MSLYMRRLDIESISKAYSKPTCACSTSGLKSCLSHLPVKSDTFECAGVIRTSSHSAPNYSLGQLRLHALQSIKDTGKEEKNIMSLISRG